MRLSCIGGFYIDVLFFICTGHCVLLDYSLVNVKGNFIEGFLPSEILLLFFKSSDTSLLMLLVV